VGISRSTGGGNYQGQVVGISRSSSGDIKAKWWGYQGQGEGLRGQGKKKVVGGACPLQLPLLTFYSDLCEAFTAANISLHKLQNPVLKGFLSKYTDRHIPDESTLRKNYIPGCYKKIMTSIQNKVADNYI
jgi:hypothetical protein